MTKEIVEAVGVLEREKGISADRLMAALEESIAAVKDKGSAAGPSSGKKSKPAKAKAKKSKAKAKSSSRAKAKASK